MNQSSGHRVRVVVADDHGLVRRGTREILEQSGSVTVVGEAADGIEAVNEVARLRPDVALLDVAMPRMSGIDACWAIRERVPGVQLLILSGHGDIGYVWEAIKAGASGYVLKDASDADLVAAVLQVAEGRSVLDPSITGSVLERVRQEMVAEDLSDELTPREIEALELAARGLSNKEIGRRLDRSPRTVETHFQNLFKKLGVGSRTEGVVVALRLGLIELGDEP